MCHRALTLVESVIVAMVLVILAFAVVPRFTEATQDARLSGLITQLESMRTQIKLYSMHHGDRFPTLEQFREQLTLSTNGVGSVAPNGTPGYPFGPYLTEIPINPFTRTNDVSDQPAGPTRAWYYDETSGLIRSNDGEHGHL